MKTLLVFCHPRADSFAAAVLAAAIDGLERGGHDVRVVDLYADRFDPVLSAAEHENHMGAPDSKPAVTAHTDDLRWCESLVLVYPTWWAGQPAMLKGWIDRVWIQGVAWELPAGARRVRPLLTQIRRITVATTHGSSKFINALEGEGGKRIVTRGLRMMCARRCKTRWIALYGIDRATADQRKRFLDRVNAQLAR